MKVEFLDRPIIVDSKPYVSNLRINMLPDRRQARLKWEYIQDVETVPVDITIHNWTPFEVKNFKLVCSIRGIEHTKNKPIRLNMTLNPTTKRLNIKGSFGDKGINNEVSMISEVFEVIKEAITN